MCETWSLTHSKEHIWRTFQNTGLKRIFGYREEEEEDITGC